MFERHEKELLEDVLASIDDLNASIAQLDADVKALVAKGSPAPEDLQPQVDAVNAIDAEVNAAVNPPA